MRELHVVATSEDGRHVVLATRKGSGSGEYRVALDGRLAAAVRGDLPRPGETEPAVVTPKEIQARLRAGESPEQVASSAGVPVAKIDRYAGPVLAERERVIAQARAGLVSRSRLGASALPLGEAVDKQLAETTGVRLETVAWAARREDSGSWLVELTYVSQARRRTAMWRYDGARREVAALDNFSAALAHVEPGRRPRSSEPAAQPPARPTARPAARAAVKSRRSPGRAAAPAVTRVAARPAVPVRAAAPVPPSVAPARAADAAAGKAAAGRKAAAAKAAAADTQRHAQAARQAQAEAAKAAKAKAASVAKAEAARAAKAEAAREAKAEAAKAAKAKAEAAKAAKAKAEAAKAAKAEAARQTQAESARRAKAAARMAKAEAAAVVKAEAERVRLEAAPAAEPATPSGPPTLRVVGSGAPAAAPRGPKAPPAAARTAPARVAGQRASVPGWADVLLSTAPVARPDDPAPDEG